MAEKDSDVEDVRSKSPNTPVTFMEINTQGSESVKGSNPKIKLKIK